VSPAVVLVITVQRQNQFAGVLAAKQRQQDLGKVTGVVADDLLPRAQFAAA
jgi:hypothetical protein